MPHCPHNFPSLRKASDGPHRRPILVIGAGLSVGLAPLPERLFADMRDEAEAALGCETGDLATDLYRWADEIIAQLINRGDPNPKLSLARALKITSDYRWGAIAPTERSKPRHRIIARFAREGLIEEIWSLNWDCWQENALENVGLKRGQEDTNLPWKTRFDTFITADDCHNIAAGGTFVVVKPHGCVTALMRAEASERKGNFLEARGLANRFLITKTELEEMRPVPEQPVEQFIFSRLCTKLASHPLIIVGWSVSEGYFIEYVRTKIAHLLAAQNDMANDELSVITLSFNEQGHVPLASFYEMTAATAHIKVEEEPGFTTDSLFLWLQALYGVERLRRYSVGAAVQLDVILARLAQPADRPDPVMTFIDDFLPVWVRLCWRCESVACYPNGVQIPADAIHLESRDEHIPWDIANILRPDLAAAGRLLGTLDASNPRRWDYTMFPGGLYDLQNQSLVIPLPAWDAHNLNDLRGLKVLIDSVRERGAGFVDRLGVLPLGATDDEQPSAAVIDRLKKAVAGQFPIARFAQSANIESAELREL
jgi:hypothetical protein